MFATLTDRRIRNILLIEDDDDTRHMLEEAMRNDGYFVRSVLTRDQATPAIQQALYQVIVMDLYMPGMNARRFVTLTRRYNPSARIILITAGDRAHEEAERLNVDYLEKPFYPDQLLAKLECLEES